MPVSLFACPAAPAAGILRAMWAVPESPPHSCKKQRLVRKSVRSENASAIWHGLREVFQQPPGAKAARGLKKII